MVGVSRSWVSSGVVAPQVDVSLTEERHDISAEYCETTTRRPERHSQM
jgi:hypothetical protein